MRATERMGKFYSKCLLRVGSARFAGPAGILPLLSLAGVVGIGTGSQEQVAGDPTGGLPVWVS